MEDQNIVRHYKGKIGCEMHDPSSLNLILDNQR
jgi:hypothetical protein